MPLNVSKGNMYPWVTHTHTCLDGECLHHCSYCYVDTLIPKQYRGSQSGRPLRFSGPLRLNVKELKVKYDRKALEKNGGKYPGIIFMEHCNDLFASGVNEDFVYLSLLHCRNYPENTYVFQTKNPLGYIAYEKWLPPNHILGCTIETNRDMKDISGAPPAVIRAAAMSRISTSHKTFITIEPILDLDVDEIAVWMKRIRPDFVNIGADSKGHNLPEPSPEKVRELLDMLGRLGIEIREKHNLERLLK